MLRFIPGKWSPQGPPGPSSYRRNFEFGEIRCSFRGRFVFPHVDWRDDVGGCHQPSSRVLYTHYKDSLLKVGFSHPQYMELIDPGTYNFSGMVGW